MKLISFDQPYERFVHAVLEQTMLLERDVRDNHAMAIAMDRTVVANGSWTEFGVFSGNTLRMMSKRRADTGMVYAFDSFRGLPDRWRNVSYAPALEKYVSRGAFSLQGRPPDIDLYNVAYIVGLFGATVPSFVHEVRRPAAFVHIDCDLFSSAQTVLCSMVPRMVHGTVVVFDELVNYPEYRLGEMLALWKCMNRSSLRMRVIGHACNKIHLKPRADHWPQAVAIQLW